LTTCGGPYYPDVERSYRKNIIGGKIQACRIGKAPNYMGGKRNALFNTENIEEE